MAVTRTEPLVVVGGGPGGLSAAIAAAELGAHVVLLDAYPQPGGQYYHQPPKWRKARATPRQRKGRALWQQALNAGVQIHSETVVWNLDERRNLSLLAPGLAHTAGSTRHAEEIQAEAIILATGAYERAAAFPGWTLPGVITSGAAQILLYHRVKPGLRVLIAGTGPLQLVTAAHLLQAGIPVIAVLEGAALTSKLKRKPFASLGALWGQWERGLEGLSSLWDLLRYNVPYQPGWGIVAAHGSQQVEGATIAQLDAHWRPVPGTELDVACDTICTGYGLIPFNALSKLAGAQQVWQAELGGEFPTRDEQMQTTIPGLYAVGDGAGIGGYRLAMLEGRLAGLSAAARLGCQPALAEAGIRRLQPALRRERAFQSLYADLFTPGPGIYELAQPDTLLCRCEGVTLAQAQRAVTQGATTLAELKALTRCGMGECQGRVCGHQMMHTLARLTGQPVEAVGTYSIRPPLFPISLKDLSE